MVQKTETVVTLIDDLDGSKADRTIVFSVDGSQYEIELSRRNAAAFEKALKPYVDAARKASGSKRPRSARGRSRTSGAGDSRKDLAAVREWAAANDIEVSSRGRISQAVHDAYNAAH